MTPRSSSSWLAFLLPVFAPGDLISQEGTWSFSGSAGYAHVFLSDVNADLRRDVDGYNNSLGYELPPFPSISPAFIFSGRVDYRFERDFSLSFSVLQGSRNVVTSYKNPEYSIALERTVGSTTAMIGIAQHFPAGQEMDLFAELQLGMLFAKATSSIDWTRTYKLTDSALVYTTEALDDTRGTFTKSKLVIAGVVGGSLPLSGPFVLCGEAMFRFAKIGKIDGTMTKFGLTNDQTTSINFDFSGFAVTLGLGVQLNQ